MRKHKLLRTGKVAIKHAFADQAKNKDSDCIATGIPGLDEVMGGGFEKESTNLIVGGPGSGKTIFGIQFLLNGIDNYNENGIYLTFEEPRNKIIKHMLKVGWDLSKYENKKKLTIINFTPEQVKNFIEDGGGLIDTAISKTKAKRIVIDSLTAFTMMHSGDLLKREACLSLFKMLEGRGCTVLLIAEHAPNLDQEVSTLLEFEADGVLLLYNQKKEDFRERSLEILKLRGAHHSSSMFPMKITEKGIKVFPQDAIF